MMNVDRVIYLARECLETPFLHQGRVAGLGLDCAGVVAHVMSGLGLPYEDATGYPRTPYARMIEQVMDRQPCMTAVPAADVRAGDFLLMRFANEPQHLAVCAGETIIHSYMHAGKCCEHRLSDVWRSRIVRAYRIKELS